ncbi:MAG: hypothetical protein HUJ56_05055 [Erysipelotrichaceae bacterium]|nr:hypothetical protein [Erysipelotrichaceae bacterium]
MTTNRKESLYDNLKGLKDELKKLDAQIDEILSFIDEDEETVTVDGFEFCRK